MILKKIPLVLFLLFSAALFAQNNYKYTLNIKGVKQKEQIQFGYWYTGVPYLLDSVMIDSAATAVVFKGIRKLDPGLYFFNVKSTNMPLDFVVNGEFEMQFSTHIGALLDSFQVAKSKENEPFFYWRTYKISREKRIEESRAMLDMLRRATKDREVLEAQTKNIRTIREDIDANTRKQVVKYPDLLFPKLIACELPAEVPVTLDPMLPTGEVNPAYVRYFRDHFWDNYDFNDTRLLRSPALARKADDWLQIQEPALDSVKQSLALAMKKSAVNQESHQKLIQLLLERFDKPSYGGNETMLVDLFDRFVPTATAAGMDTASWMRLQYKANAYRATLPGRIAPEIRLRDTAGVEVSLFDFKAKYTLLYFFSPLCAHCKEATPDIYALTLPYADKGVRVFAVTTDGRVDYWKDYVKQNLNGWTCVADPDTPSAVEKMYATHSLPNLLLLDEQKKILVRRLPLSDLGRVLPGLVR